MSKLETLSDLDAERALLGACLLSERAIDDSLQHVEAGDFYIERHRQIYAAIVDQRRTGIVDIVTVAAAMRDDGALDYLRELTDATPTISNAGQYAYTVADCKRRRDLIWFADAVTQRARDAEDAGQALDDVAGLLGKLDRPVVSGTPDPTIDEFIDNTPIQYDWLIEDFLERRDRMLVTAGEGAGKSVLIAQIGVMAAAGIHPWTLQPIEPCNVAIIDLENGPRLLARRLRWLRRNARHIEPHRIRIHADPRGINLTTRTDKRWLIERCLANKTDLLVIGPAYRMMAGVQQKGDMGGEDYARQVTAALDEVRSQCNVTLLMETHAPHSRDGMTRDLRPQGSSVWLRWPEFGIGIRKDGPSDEETSEYQVTHWRGPRDERTWPKKLVRGGNSWPWMPSGMPNGTFTQRRTA